MPHGRGGAVRSILTISVERIETTAGMTRAATSANEGIVTAVHGAALRGLDGESSVLSMSASGRDRR